MQLSTAGELALKAREGREGKPSFIAYDDADPTKVLRPGDLIKGTLTVGWGHTGPDIKIGEIYTEDQCNQWFSEDISWVSACISRNVRVPLTQGQYDALTSFIFNIGQTAFETQFSGLKYLNKGNYAAVPSYFDLWNKTLVDGKLVVNEGLVNRRNSEDGQWVKGSFVTGSRVHAEPPTPLWKTPKIKALGTAMAGVTGSQLTAAAAQAQALSSTWHFFSYVFGALSVLGILFVVLNHNKH